jgi:hypothetical protein
MGLEKDLPPGEELIALFHPFFEYLAGSDLSPKAIQKHVDNMWMPGGEFIRDPLLHHGDEDQQTSFDSTCRKFRRFLARKTE